MSQHDATPPPPALTADPEGERESPLRELLREILHGYCDAKATKSVHQPSRPRLAFDEARDLLQASAAVGAHPGMAVRASTGNGEWSHVPWLAFCDPRETASPAGGVTVMLLFRPDMSGVYLGLMQGVGALKKALGGIGPAREAMARRAEEVRGELAPLAARGFHLGCALDLRAETRGKQRARVAYEGAALAHKLYEAADLPDDDALLADVGAALDAYDRLVSAHPRRAVAASPTSPEQARPRARFDRRFALLALTDAIAARGFVFEPWQIAAYVTALRTRPFLVLAGVSGTGKSRLPRLIAELTGGVSAFVAVRPGWTDSRGVLGATDERGRFCAGPLLRIARAAAANPGVPHVCVIDELNQAPVELYLAEVLSRLEDREGPSGAPGASGPLLAQRPADPEGSWGDVGLPANLSLVGTVNLDESARAFGRRVLDRAFWMGSSELDLAALPPASGVRATAREMAAMAMAPWPAEAFQPRALRLGALERGPGEEAIVRRAVETLIEVNTHLGASLQIGYRVRDEVALFLLHAEEVRGAFVTRRGVVVDPLDVALEMRILPRLALRTHGVRAAVTALLGWALGEATLPGEAGRQAARAAGLPEREQHGQRGQGGARFPRTTARLARMAARLAWDEGGSPAERWMTDPGSAVPHPA